MTITSPQPGIFIGRPSWIGSAPINAAHTLGNNNTFPTTFRRADATVIASLLAIEEAYWERAYYLYSLHESDARLPIPQLANFFIYNTGYGKFTASDALAFPTTPPGTLQYPKPYSTPKDRAFSTRRIYRPALEWMLKNFLWSPTYNAPSFWNFLCETMGASNSVTPSGGGVRLISSPLYPYGDGQFVSSSLLGDTTPVFPSLPWTDVADLITALASWRGAHTLNACANDGVFRNTAPDLNAALIQGMANLVGWSIGGWQTDAAEEAFINAHRVSALNSFGSIISSAFGKSYDYSILRSESRRLWYERLGAYSQAIAAIDRTYGVANVAYWTKDGELDTTYKVEATVEGTLPASSIDWTQRPPVVREGAQVSWGSTSYQQSTSEKTLQLLDPGHYAFIAHGHCNSSADSAPVPLTQMYADPHEIALLFDFGPPISGDSIPFTIAPAIYDPDSLDGIIWYDITRTDTQQTIRLDQMVPITPPSGTIPVTIEGSAAYDYIRTTAPNMRGVLPDFNTWQAGVIREIEAFSMVVQREASRLSPDYSPTAYVQPVQVRCSRGVVSTFNDYQALFYNWDLEEMQRSRSVLAQRYPFEIGNLSALQSRLSQAISDSKQFIEFTPRLVFAPSGTVTGYLRGTYGDPIITFTTPPGDGYLGSLLYELVPSAEASRSVPDYIVAVRSEGILRRVDWNFNTLRLNP